RRGHRLRHPFAGSGGLPRLRGPGGGGGRLGQGRARDFGLRHRHRDRDDREQGPRGASGLLPGPLHRAHEPGAQRRERPGPGWPADRDRGGGGDRGGVAPERVPGRAAQPAPGQVGRGGAALPRGRVGRGGVSMQRLEQADPEVAKAIRQETERQSRNLELIASENFVSEAVLEAVGSVMTNKYAEGYPGRRYYGGCGHVDTVEGLAGQPAQGVFGAEHANVQPHSGSQANMAVYFTVLQPGDTILGPNLSHGGHLTMGSPVNFSGRLYKVVPYGVRREDERIDFDQLRALAREHRPK